MRKPNWLLLAAALALPLALYAQEGGAAAAAPLGLAEKIVYFSAAVSMIVQGVKKIIERLLPQIAGAWLGIALNLALAVLSVIVATPAGQLFSVETLLALLAIFAGASWTHALLGRNAAAPAK